MADEEDRTRTTIDPNPIEGGILCPNCGCPHHYVTDTRQSETKFWGIRKQYIRRRRVCRYCQLPFQTREVIEPDLPDTIKSPEHRKQVQAKIKETLGNVLPSREGLDIGDLPNPFL